MCDNFIQGAKICETHPSNALTKDLRMQQHESSKKTNIFVMAHLKRSFFFKYKKQLEAVKIFDNEMIQVLEKFQK